MPANMHRVVTVLCRTAPWDVAGVSGPFHLASRHRAHAPVLPRHIQHQPELMLRACRKQRVSQALPQPHPSCPPRGVQTAGGAAAGVGCSHVPREHHALVMATNPPALTPFLPAGRNNPVCNRSRSGLRCPPGPRGHQCGPNLGAQRGTSPPGVVTHSGGVPRDVLHPTSGDPHKVPLGPLQWFLQWIKPGWKGRPRSLHGQEP